MKSNREAKKILKKFGKESFKQRINYIEPFMEKKTSFFSSIRYRHVFSKAVIVILLLIVIPCSAFAISKLGVYEQFRAFFVSDKQTTSDEDIINFFKKPDGTMISPSDISYDIDLSSSSEPIGDLAKDTGDNTVPFILDDVKAKLMDLGDAPKKYCLGDFLSEDEKEYFKEFGVDADKVDVCLQISYGYDASELDPK